MQLEGCLRCVNSSELLGRIGIVADLTELEQSSKGFWIVICRHKNAVLGILQNLPFLSICWHKSIKNGCGGKRHLQTEIMKQMQQIQ